jgi:hypothetical protein
VVWAVKFSPRDLSLSETVAPTTAEPSGSRTVPVTAPPVTWAATAPAKATSATIAKSSDLILSEFMINSLLLVGSEKGMLGVKTRLNRNQDGKLSFKINNRRTKWGLKT